MADIIVKIAITGEAISLDDVDLDQLTGRELIELLIVGGVLAPEFQHSQEGCPPIQNTLLDKNGARLEPDDTRKLAEFRYTDGDTVRIIQRGCGSC